jgi:hypothetical protein
MLNDANALQAAINAAGGGGGGGGGGSNGPLTWTAANPNPGTVGPDTQGNTYSFGAAQANQGGWPLILINGAHGSWVGYTIQIDKSPDNAAKTTCIVQSSGGFFYLPTTGGFNWVPFGGPL